MNTYSWDCKTVDTYPTQGELTDIVYNVHWRLTGTDATGGHSATIIGTQTLTVENIQPEGFISFEALTHEQVIEWIEEAMGEDRIADLKSSFDNQITDKITPKSVTKVIGEVVTLPIIEETPEEVVEE